MSDELFVSILINNYNYGRFLAEAIDSALAQTYASKEIIVVDDGSTDDSKSIIEGYGSQIISIFKENGGQASTFNAGFQASKGDIICFLDADDMFLSKKLDTIVQIFEENPDIDWCFHPLKLLNTNDSNQVLNHVYARLPSSRHDFTKGMLQGKRTFTYPATSGTCFTRVCLEKILPMPEEITIASDNYIKYVATSLAKGFFQNEELAVQRIHGNNAYTMNNRYIQLKAKYAILVGYWIQIRYPFLFKFTDCLIAQDGITGCWKAGLSGPDVKVVLDEYLTEIGLTRKLKIYIRAFYQFTKIQLKTWLSKVAS